MCATKKKIALTVVFSVALALLISPAWSGEIRIGTGAAAAENIFKKIKYPLERSSSIKLNIVESGPVQAWKDLDAGTIDCAVGGLSFADWVEMMKKTGYAIADQSAYNHCVIGTDKVMVLVNKDIPVTSLTQAQLNAIFTGKSKNWSQVGGPKIPIIVVMGDKISGTLSVFQKQILENAEFTKDAMMGTTAEDVKSRIIRNTGAIGLGTLSQVNYLVNAPAIPEIARPIVLVTKGVPNQDIAHMITYIQRDGKEFIGK